MTATLSGCPKQKQEQPWPRQKTPQPAHSTPSDAPRAPSAYIVPPRPTQRDESSTRRDPHAHRHRREHLRRARSRAFPIAFNSLRDMRRDAANRRDYLYRRGQ